jgi:undecaprenyl-diphosphatase
MVRNGRAWTGQRRWRTKLSSTEASLSPALGLERARALLGLIAPRESTRDRLDGVLEHQLAQVVSLDLATSIVRRAIAAAGSTSEADQARRASVGPGSGLDSIRRLTRTRRAAPRLAAVLLKMASQGLGSTKDASVVADAAYDVLGSGPHAISAAAERGRSRLRSATLDSLTATDWLEARLFLALSCLPHPVWPHVLCEAVGAASTGGLIWVAGVLCAYLLRIPRSDRALKFAGPIVAMTAFVAEKPAKAFFAPRRPFSHLLWMMLLGRKPRGQSFPSGHAATSFAGAWTLGSVWPGRRGVFLGLATLVSLSRVYLGAHDPGEILAGVVLGLGLAEALRRPTERLLAGINVAPVRLGRASQRGGPSGSDARDR